MTRPQALTRRDLGLVLVACVWLAFTVGMRPLMLPDEGRYVGVAWEMLRHGDALTPTLDGLPFFHKPPLFYWIGEVAMALAGPVAWAGRLASLMGAGLAAAAVYWLTLRWCGRRLAGQALLALSVQPLFFLGGQFANLDMLVAGCITAAIALLADAVLSLEAGQPWRRSLWAAYGAAGLGVLAKGLIGVVLPGLVIVAWLLATRRWRRVWQLLSLPGLLLLAVVTVPWFAAMQQRHDGFLDYFFYVQHFKRFATGGFNNVQPVWFYPLLLGLCFAPWLPWLARLVPLQRAAPAAGEGQQLRLLMMLWVVVVVVFFSLPRSKLIGYVLPAVMPLAWLAADAFSATGAWPRAWRIAAGIGALVSLGTVVGLAIHPVHSNRVLAQALLQHRQAGEPVVMAGDYYYDMPFYARLEMPIHVVEAWDSPDVDARDNWRKELADAGRFAPESARQRLVLPADVPRLLCAAPRTWVIGRADAAVAHPLLAAATTVDAQGDLRLWRFEPGATPGACPQTPTTGPAGR